MLRPTPKRYQQTNPKTYPQKGASWWGKTPHQLANSILEIAADQTFARLRGLKKEAGKLSYVGRKAGIQKWDAP